MSNKTIFFLELDEFLVFQRQNQPQPPPSNTLSHRSVTQETEGSSTSEMTMIQVSWTKNHTKIFLDLYKKYKPKVGSIHIKNFKKL